MSIQSIDALLMGLIDRSQTQGVGRVSTAALPPSLIF
jgi:hypothetical protein